MSAQFLSFCHNPTWDRQTDRHTDRRKGLGNVRCIICSRAVKTGEKIRKKTTKASTPNKTKSFDCISMIKYVHKLKVF